MYMLFGKKTDCPLNAVVRLAAGICIAFVCMSCEFLNLGVREYLEEYTENASVASSSFDAEYPVDADGVICIPSGMARTVSFILRNPQQYVLDFSYSFPDLSGEEYTDTERLQSARVQAAALEDAGRTPVSFLQQEQDTSLVTMTLSGEFLTLMEGGGDLSLSLGLTEPKSQRTFAPYWISMRCNSVPLPVRNLTVLKEPSQDGGGTYVLCFNMPDMSGIHQDICRISINGTEFEVSPDGSAAGTGITGIDGFSSVYSDTWEPALAAGQTFSGKDLPRAVYFDTGIELTDEDYPFAVILSDKKGLTASSVASAQSEKLESVTVTVPGGDLLTTGAQLDPDEDGYVQIALTAPADNADASVCWIVRNASDGSERQQGKTAGSAVIPLSSGTYNIEVWAQKNGFVDSEVTSVTGVTVRGAAYYYVSSADNNGSSNNPGTRNQPFAAVQDAVNAIQKNGIIAETTYTVYLLSDITDDASGAYSENLHSALISVDPPASGDRLNMRLCGFDGNMRTINANRSSTGTGRVLYIGGNATVTLKDITLKGGFLAADEEQSIGAGVYVDGGMLAVQGAVRVIDNVAGEISSNVYLPSGSTIAVTGELTGSSIGIAAEDTPTITKPVVFTSGYRTYNSGIHPSEYFSSCTFDGNAFGIGTDSDGEAQLVVSGGGISAPEITVVSFTFEPAAAVIYTTGSDLERTVTVTAHCAGETVIDPETGTETETVKDITGDITGWSFKLYNHGVDTGLSGNSGEPNTLTIPAGYPADTYQLSVTGTYNGAVYSGQFDIAVAVPVSSESGTGL